LIENAGLSATPLEHLGLYTWWKPSSWYRVILESFHTHYNLSWIAAIICSKL
uniref:Polyprotein n=1 Tax=Gongylonema pulchrum TaxID=637853 RepID=A0A183EUP8_9BILA